jgi:hypothetical protein
MKWCVTVNQAASIMESTSQDIYNKKGILGRDPTNQLYLNLFNVRNVIQLCIIQLTAVPCFFQQNSCSLNRIQLICNSSIGIIEFLFAKHGVNIITKFFSSQDSCWVLTWITNMLVN